MSVTGHNTHLIRSCWQQQLRPAFSSSIESSGDPPEVERVPSRCPSQSDCSFGTLSSQSSWSGPSFSQESVLDGLEVNNEEELQAFMQKMKNGLQNFLKNAKMSSWPLHYNKIGDPALQTKCWHAFKTAKRTKAYHAQGYPDISSFFQMNGGPNFPTIQGGTCCQRFKSELGHLDSVTSRTHLEAEEEEEGEEEVVVVMAEKDRNSRTRV